MSVPWAYKKRDPAFPSTERNKDQVTEHNMKSYFSQAGLCIYVPVSEVKPFSPKGTPSCKDIPKEISPVPVRLFMVSYLQPARFQFWLLLVFSLPTQKFSKGLFPSPTFIILKIYNCQFSLPVFPDKSVHHHPLLLWKWICSVSCFLLTWKKDLANLISLEAVRIQLEVKQILSASTGSTSCENIIFLSPALNLSCRLNSSSLGVLQYHTSLTAAAESWESLVKWPTRWSWITSF